MKSVEPNDNLYAVIIVGMHDHEFWNDASAIYCALKNAGYKDDKIIVHYAISISSISKDFDRDGTDDIDFEATKNEIKETFENLKDILRPDDQLFVYIGDHGSSSNGNSSILLPGEYDLLYDYEFAEYIREINCAQMIFVMAQCHSGGFINDIMSYKSDPLIVVKCKNRIIQTSCADTEIGYQELWLTQRNATEFSYYWSAAVRQEYYLDWGWSPYESAPGQFPFTRFAGFEDHPADYNSDKNMDGYVQMGEAFEYANNFDSFSKPEAGSHEINYYNPYPYPISPIPRIETPQMESRIGFQEDLLSLSGICGHVRNTQVITDNFMVNPSLIIDPEVSLILSDNSEMYCTGVLTIEENAKIILIDASKLTIKSDCTLVLKDGSEFVIEQGANLIFEKGSQIIIEGNAKITGNIGNAYTSITVTDGSRLSLGANSLMNIWSVGDLSLNLGLNSELVIEPGAQMTLNPYTPSVCAAGSKITIQGSGKLNAYETSFSGSPEWKGIEAQVGSSVKMIYTAVKSAQNALSAIGSVVNVTGSSFVDCFNGVSLTNCTGYTLNNNYFKGMNSGYDYGISLTECGGSITGNTVTNFGRGVILTLSSVNLINNKINSNRLSGVYVTGYNIPQMINSSGNIELNNDVKNNGDVQILLIYHANVYLTNGYNNIYSDPIDAVPTVPCIYTAGWQLEPEDQLGGGKAVLPNIVGIHAEMNFWGYSGKISDNFDSFFGVGINTLHQGYSLTYEPYALDPYTALPGIPPRVSSNEPPSTESNLLSTAMMLEDKGNIKAAIKKYEQILSKYPDSPEAYVADARLPEIYILAERDVSELLISYDEALESDVVTDKKFYKQMKITTNTKSANYDDAIIIAEEMKAEAQTEAEVTLAEISIAIAETMKNNGKSDDRIGAETISNLLAKLTGKSGEEPVGNPSDITVSVIPESTELYQNYPNPFNPVTQIRFDLAITAKVTLSVYNVNGQIVAELANGVMNAGNHAVEFDGNKLNTGIYYYTLEVEGKSFTQKMILMK